MTDTGATVAPDPNAEPPLTAADMLAHEAAAREQHRHGMVHDRAACVLCPPAPPAATPGQAEHGDRDYANLATVSVRAISATRARLKRAEAERDAALAAVERLAYERDTARDALGKILRGLSGGEGQPLTDDEIITIASGVLGGDHA